MRNRIIKSRRYLAGLLLLLAGLLPAQRYGGFLNLNVEEGLLQSQAMAIAQDANRYLWVATLGGLNRYNGREFVQFTRTEGLRDITVQSVYCDRQGRTWAGSLGTITLIDGHKLRSYPLPADGKPARAVQDIVQTPQGRLLARAGNALFQLIGDTLQPLPLAEKDAPVTGLQTDARGEVWAIAPQGIYQWATSGWSQEIALPQAWEGKIYTRRLLFTSRGDTLLATSSGIFRLNEGRFDPFGEHPMLRMLVYDLEEDAEGNIWAGLAQGACRIGTDTTIHFTEARGLTNNPVFDLLRDAEGNLWFATDEDGIFRYRDPGFTVYDQLAGLTDPTVMSITRWRGDLVVSTRNAGLFRIENNRAQPIPLPGRPHPPMLNAMLPDSSGNLWLGTLGAGLWRLDRRGDLHEMTGKTGQKYGGIHSLHLDPQYGVFAGGLSGLYQVDDATGTLERRSILAATTILPYGPDTLLLGSTKGAYWYHMPSGKLTALPYPELADATFVGSFRHGERFYLGSADRGLIILDKRGTVRQFSKTDGLPSNFIYSIWADKDHIWLGTGYGIVCLEIDGQAGVRRTTRYGVNDGLPSMETNQNAIFRDHDGALWFGLTKGLVRFREIHPAARQAPTPLVHLNVVQLFSQPLARQNGVPRFGSNENHLTFELDGLSLSEPHALLYKYRLVGLEDDFSLSTQPRVVFSAIPPGEYAFEAYALTADSCLSANRVYYPFVIRTPFYRAWWFRLSVLALLIGGIVMVYRLRLRQQEQRRLELERVRAEEFNRLRKRTAEDFHDEMGNKLTRISILSDILRMKLSAESQEARNLVDQIKENVAALYSGSKDIIWSLHPQHDDLQTVLERLRDIGSELFSETDVDFYFEQEDPAPPLKLTLEYSRNLQMITKEVFNNVLRHAAATEVTLTFRRCPRRQEYVLEFIDNGRGFSTGTARAGNGLSNLRNRAERLHAELELDSTPGGGTRITLHLGLLTGKEVAVGS